MNYFAFRKVGKKGYAHALFDRSLPQLVLEIKRKTNTGNLNKNRKAVSRSSRRKCRASDENKEFLQNTTVYNVPSTPSNDTTKEPMKREASSYQPVSSARIPYSCKTKDCCCSKKFHAKGLFGQNSFRETIKEV